MAGHMDSAQFAQPGNLCYIPTPPPYFWGTSPSLQRLLAHRQCSANTLVTGMEYDSTTGPVDPHLSQHGLGKDFSPPWTAQHIRCLQEDLGPVCHRLQVPLFPGGQGSFDGFVEQGLQKERYRAVFCLTQQGMEEGH